jgi:glycosyltransferase involved in cell wall biosynthesis
MPLISIIIPNYNHAEFLEQRILSVINQTFQDFELILLDDCSTDESSVILDRYKNHPKVSNVLYNTSNSGSTFSQWNKGVDIATSEWINIAESDDYSDSRFLEKLIALTEHDSQIVLAYCQSNKVDRFGNYHGDWSTQTKNLPALPFDVNFIMEGEKFVDEFLIKTNYIPNASAVIFRKSVYLKAGGANPSIEKCGDWYIWIRVLLLGKVGFVCEALNNFRFHANSVIAKESEIKSLFSKFYYDTKLRNQLKKDLQNSKYRTIYSQNNDLIKDLKYHEVAYLVTHGFYLFALKKSFLLAVTDIGFWKHIPNLLKVFLKSIVASKNT